MQPHSVSRSREAERLGETDRLTDRVFESEKDKKKSEVETVRRMDRQTDLLTNRDRRAVRGVCEREVRQKQTEGER